jgi:hypothetical protein
MLGFLPSLRAERASDFIAKTSLVVGPVMINSHGSQRCGSESCGHDHPAQTIATTGRIITISATGRTMRVSNSLPLRTGEEVQPKSNSSVKNAYEYTVVTTGDTVFQDGVDAIRFEDFKSGETISIHGVLKGTTLTAFRLAKWE